MNNRSITVGATQRHDGRWAIVVGGDIHHNLAYSKRSFALSKALAFAKKIYSGWSGQTTYTLVDDVDFTF